jgi:drug/metabolite transporter (DMT)-like permease
MQHAGELAALGTSFCWTISALSFTAGGRRIGALPVNLIRLFLALVFLSLITWANRGLPLPIDASGRIWFWLGLSGFVGFFLGDLFLFQSFMLIGPRLAMLIMCLWPPMAALLSWLTLDRRLTVSNLVGMGVTLAGVAWVTAGHRPAGADEVPEPDLSVRQRLKTLRGVLLAILGAAGQATGYVLGGLVIQEIDAFAATEIRVLAAIAGFLGLFAALRAWPRLWAARGQPGALALVALGSFFGPCLGVALSLHALKYIPAGIAGTLASLTPVIIIPVVVVLHGERVSPRAILGTCIAVAGVALLFLG